jgi:hypothetical protein
MSRREKELKNRHLTFKIYLNQMKKASPTRSKNKISPYAHTLKPEIEKYVNQIEWEANTLVDTEQQESPSVTISQTTTP